MAKKINILLTVAARGGSKGVKNKNIKPILGKPLIAYTIEHAKKWGRATEIICSTDSDAIAQEALRCGALVPFKRPEVLSGDKVGKIPVLRHALQEAERIFKKRYDIVVDLDVTAPLRKVSDVEECYQLFLKKKADTVFSVVSCKSNPYFNMVEQCPDGRVVLAKRRGDGKAIVSRQGAPKVFDMNGSIYVYRREYLLDERSTVAISNKSYAYEMDDVSKYDIDEEIDFRFVSYLMEQRLSNDYQRKFRLDKKIAVVMGACGLIGTEISRALAQAGARVILADINTKKGKALEQSIKANNGDAVFYPFDISQRGLMEKQFTDLFKTFKQVDIYVNTAYVYTGDWGLPSEEVTEMSWAANVDLQMNSFCLTSKIMAQMMKAKKIQGNIINIGSIYGMQAPDFTVYKGTMMTTPAAYAAIKGGVLNFSRYLAAYYGPDHIRVNVVSPGGVFDHQNPIFVRQYNARTPLRRMARSEDIAYAVLYLASEASDYVTGTNLVVDGGWTVV